MIEKIIKNISPVFRKIDAVYYNDEGDKEIFRIPVLGIGVYDQGEDKGLFDFIICNLNEVELQEYGSNFLGYEFDGEIINWDKEIQRKEINRLRREKKLKVC